MSRRIILLLSAVFLEFAFTRSAPMVIDVINSEKGLLSNTILSITEDSFGRMWIGTANGISCYNGDMPMNISVNTAPRRISNKYAQSLLPMENGDVWIGTPDRLNIYSYQGDSVFIANRQEIGISDITALLMSRDKRTIWIGSTDQGVGAYDLPEGRFRKLQFPDSTNLPKHIITLCEDPNDYLWIGTRYDGIYIYDLKNGKLSGFPMQHATVNALCTGRSGTMWIGTHDGLFGGTVNGPMVRISHPMVDHIKIMAIVEDRNGTIWVGGDNGLVAFSPESVTPDNRITDLRSVSEGPGIGKLTYRYVSALYYDKKQTLWVGTFGGGINILDISEFSPSVITPIEDMQDGNSSNKTLAICRGNDDDLWFGMDGHGVVRYDLKTGQKQVFSGSDIHDSVIVSLCRDENGYIWAGGYYNGLAYLAPGSDRFVAIRNTPHNETIRAIATDEGKIYYNNDSDLFCYDFLSKRTTRPLAGRLNKKLDIRTIVIDRETIWLGTYHNGIIGYDRETGRITEIPVHKDFGNAVVWDMVLFDRQLWCATDLGLFRTDLTGDPLRGEFIASPDPGSKSFVAVASDDNGKLWLSGTSKIYCYDITAQKYTQVTTPKMLSVTDYSDAAILIDRTETYVGGFKGVAIVRDRRESPDTIQARELFLANLNINNHPVYPGARRSPLKKNLNGQERIVLSHKQNNISLDFIIPYFGYEIASYRYRIKERSNEWSELGASHTLSINNMPYGKYTLEIEGSIADSPKVFSRTLQLVFRPPFYLSTGAKSLYLLLVVLAAFVAVRITKTRIELKHTLEMEQANRKKDEELNEAKISFFTTISHELRTPLTLLLAPIDQLKAYETNSSKLKNYQLIERNAKTLLSLVNQILDFRKNEKGGDPPAGGPHRHPHADCGHHTSVRPAGRLQKHCIPGLVPPIGDIGLYRCRHIDENHQQPALQRLQIYGAGRQNNADGRHHLQRTGALGRRHGHRHGQGTAGKGVRHILSGRQRTDKIRKRTRIVSGKIARKDSPRGYLRREHTRHRDNVPVYAALQRGFFHRLGIRSDGSRIGERGDPGTGYAAGREDGIGRQGQGGDDPDRGGQRGHRRVPDRQPRGKVQHTCRLQRSPGSGKTERNS